MSALTPPEGPRPAAEAERGPEIPREYSDVYVRAYRRSLAEHPTELLSPARPGKRAAEPTRPTSLRVRAEKALADVLADPRRRLIAGAGATVVLLLIAYGAGRLAA